LKKYDMQAKRSVSLLNQNNVPEPDFWVLEGFQVSDKTSRYTAKWNRARSPISRKLFSIHSLNRTILSS